MFLPPRVLSTRPKSRHAQRPATLNVLPRSTSCHAQRPATLNVLPPRLLQAEPFFFAATKFESDAERCCGRDRRDSGNHKKRMTSADVILL